ncbi:hypothetical protein LTR53_005119 [Teratosphaeriaceae sp. CCFEE 6253]|nr:hypothetical protein LTR53_005119 [Teratosphaeriaceae sp. CCFEE 6253]
MFQEDLDDHIGGGDPTVAHFGAKDIGWQALGPAIACVAVSTCVVALRWYTRCRLVRCVGWDDYVILLSMLLAWAMCAIIGAAVHQGVGVVHGSPLEISIVTKLVVANNDLWSVLVNVTKASILMQYLRIFQGPKTRAACYGLLATLVPVTLWAVLGGTLLCTPAAKLWDPEIPGHCLSAQRYWVSVACINIGLDFLVLLLPIPAIAALRLPRKQKVTMLMVFLLGFFVCAISVSRLASVLVTAKSGAIIQSGIYAIIFSVVEANVGIICACLLALKPLIGHWWPKLLEEDGLPRHCMRLPHVQTAATTVWPSADSTATLVSPTTPTTMKSKSESMFKRPSLVSPTMPVVREVMYPHMPLAVACAGALGFG